MGTRVERAQSRRCALIALGVAAVVLAITSGTDVDFRLSDLLYRSGGGQWPVNHAQGWVRFALYEGPKYLIAALWLALLAGLAMPRLLAAGGLSRGEAGYLLLGIALVPLIVAGIKYHSGIVCAAELARYGGKWPDVEGHFTLPRFLAAAGQRGCWPSGHASGGFALFSLAALDRPARTRLALWLSALALGTAMGAYQIARGAHFVSHVVATALIAQILVCLLAAVLSPWLTLAGRGARVPL